MPTNDETYKYETKKLFDMYASRFADKFAPYLSKFIKREADEFLVRVPENGRILDIGCGSGDHALYFKDRGFDVVCTDISEEMVKICKSRDLKAQVMDFEKMNFDKESFDAVWAYTSLLHVPKRNLEGVLQQIEIILKDDGVFFIGMKEGKGEGLVSDSRYKGVKKWMSLFEDDELQKILEKYFVIESFSKTKVDETHTFLNYLCAKSGR